MQASRRSGCRTQFPRINRLIAFFILQLLRDVRRQRHLSDFIQHCIEISVTGELHNAVAIRLDFYDLCQQLSAAKRKLRADFCFLAGAADNLPQLISFLLQQQEFNKCPVVYFLPVEPCRQNPGIVHHQQVTLLQDVA